MVYPSDSPLPIRYASYVKNGLISYSKCRLCAYNPSEPIFVKEKDNLVYELSEHPERKCDWDKRTSFWHTQYAYIPYLRLKGISEEEINKMKTIFSVGYPSQFNKEHNSNNLDINSLSVNMQPLQIGHNLQDEFLEI